MSITTIKLLKDTKKRLDKIREYKKESYDEIISKILDILNICKLDPPKARRVLIQIDNKRNKLKNLEVYSQKEFKEKFNLQPF